MPITVSGTAITFNDATTQTTAFTGGGGTVTSVATGNGLQGGTITSTGTLSVACPTFNTVGSYCGIVFAFQYTGVSVSSGTNYSVGDGTNQVRSGFVNGGETLSLQSQNNLSGTWKWMGATNGFVTGPFSVGCRVS